METSASALTDVGYIFRLVILYNDSRHFLLIFRVVALSSDIINIRQSN